MCRTETGESVPATFYPQPRGVNNPPGILFLHGRGSKRADWADFAAKMSGEGFAVLVPAMPDLETAREERVTFLLSAFLDGLVQAGADPQNLAAVAETEAASLLFRFACRHSALQAVALVSPGLDYFGVDMLALIAGHKELPVLLLAAENDAYSAAAASALKSAAAGFCELRAYPGSARGVELLSLSPHAVEQLTQGLQGLLTTAP